MLSSNGIAFNCLNVLNYFTVAANLLMSFCGTLYLSSKTRIRMAEHFTSMKSVWFDRSIIPVCLQTALSLP